MSLVRASVRGLPSPETTVGRAGISWLFADHSERPKGGSLWPRVGKTPTGPARAGMCLGGLSDRRCLRPNDLPAISAALIYIRVQLQPPRRFTLGRRLDF